MHWIGFQNNQINNALVRGGPYRVKFQTTYLQKVSVLANIFWGLAFSTFCNKDATVLLPLSLVDDVNVNVKILRGPYKYQKCDNIVNI